MKRNIIFITFGFIILSVLSGQEYQAIGALNYEDSLKFLPLHEWIFIPDSANDLWEKGIPQKAFFNIGHSGAIPILTDSAAPYPENCNDYFFIRIPWSDYFWGEGILSFYHKYDSDTLKEGGIIEMSYSNGSDWINILDDRNHIDFRYAGLYEDTIMGGVYGFSGKSSGWEYVELYWHWVALVKKKSNSEELDKPLVRFRFISDQEDTGKEGWMIDDIVFRGYDAIGNLEELKAERIEVFPLPARDYVIFRSNNVPIINQDIRIYSLIGKVVMSGYLSNGKINIEEMARGVYIYKMKIDEKNYSGILIKE